MDSIPLMLIVATTVACIAGPLTARSTERREKIYGGTPARILNLIACMMFVAILPTVLTGLIVGHGVGIVPVGFGILGISLLSTVGFAIIEKPARDRLAPKAQRSALNSWTEDDARKSGL
ncbi:MAG: hypothetical protein KA401_04610 [Anaerolineae bacterium]|nr:hypothetical protein [Chloroflexota bacterium]MBP6298607.1 hypothetical protein [Anaerolineae bacterium]